MNSSSSLSSSSSSEYRPRSKSIDPRRFYVSLKRLREYKWSQLSFRNVKHFRSLSISNPSFSSSVSSATDYSEESGPAVKQLPYLPPELIAAIAGKSIEDAFINPGSDEGTESLQSLKALALVSRTFHDAVIAACRMLADSWFLPFTERVIDNQFRAFTSSYAMLYEPIVPIYALAGLLKLELWQENSKSRDDTTTHNNISVTFKEWDPVSLYTLLLVWDRQAGLGYDVPNGRINLTIRHADSEDGHVDDRMLLSAFSQLRYLEFRNIYLCLPEASLPVKDAKTIAGRFRSLPPHYSVGKINGFVCANYEFFCEEVECACADGQVFDKDVDPSLKRETV